MVGAGTVALLIHRYDNSVHRGDLLDDQSRAQEQGIRLKGPLNYLLLGSTSDPAATRQTVSAPTPS